MPVVCEDEDHMRQGSASDHCSMAMLHLRQAFVAAAFGSVQEPRKAQHSPEESDSKGITDGDSSFLQESALSENEDAYIRVIENNLHLRKTCTLNPINPTKQSWDVLIMLLIIYSSVRCYRAVSNAAQSRLKGRFMPSFPFFQD